MIHTELKIINIEAIKCTNLNRDPYEYAVIRNVIKEDSQKTLLEAFPDGRVFEETKKSAIDKQYRMFHCPIIAAGNDSVTDIQQWGKVWDDLCNDIRSSQYREAISKLTGRNLEDHIVTASLWKYDANCFLAAHTDKPEKIITHLIYLNEEWDESNGGCLLLHEDSAEKRVVRTIVPVIDQSVVLVTSDKSWHSVEPVVSGDERRKSIQIVFWDAQRC